MPRLGCCDWLLNLGVDHCLVDQTNIISGTQTPSEGILANHPYHHVAYGERVCYIPHSIRSAIGNLSNAAASLFNGEIPQ